MGVFATINLIIAAQALFLCVHFLLKKKGAKTLNRLLGFLCFAFAMLGLNTYLNLIAEPIRDSFLQDISNNLMWFVGPSMYLYTIYKDRPPNRKQIYLNTLPYLLPAAIDLFANWDWYTRNISFVGFVQMSIYLFLSIRYSIKNYGKSKQYYNWILPPIVAFAVLIAVNFSLSVLRVSGVQVLADTTLQSFTSLLVIPIFFLAYKEMNSTNDFGLQPEKYKSTHLSEEKSKGYLVRIERAMKTDQLFLHKSLTLQKFSQHVGIHPKYISQAINQHLAVSFSDYVLQYRLEHVKERLLDPANDHLTMFGIAQDSGFNSNSRFSHLFKKHTGLTPKQYQKQNAK